ncbi:hypothetical protein ACIOMM_03790 [Streptomyces sp. NPDC087908]|uniref:hypothetical protein n=1 Tax=Streptomyces sp. NPDC087908 TaxID=3365820 RepID=UPI003812BDDE
MARDKQERWAAGSTDGDARSESAPPPPPQPPPPLRTPGEPTGSDVPTSAGREGTPVGAVPAQRSVHAAADDGTLHAAVPAQRDGDATPPAATPSASRPPVAESPTSAPASEAAPTGTGPAGQRVSPSDGPGAPGRNDGSGKHAPVTPPSAPGGRTTKGTADDRTPGRDDRTPGENRTPGDNPTPGAGRTPGGDHRADRTAAGTDGLPGTHHRQSGDESADGAAGQLLDAGERDRLGERLHHALAGFVDSPRDSVAEAADLLEETERQLVAALRDRRTALRAGWQQDGDQGRTAQDTEQLRLTLRTYREVTERLLRA